MKSFAIFSPILGLREDVPSILMKEAYTPDCQDVIWQDGEVHRIRKRLLEFTYQFPDKILNLEYYLKPSTDEWWFLIFTKRDIAYRDIVNDRFVFINKLYTTGTITIEATNLKKVTGTGTAFSTNTKAGDFFKIGAEAVHTDSTWYEVDSVESDTVLYLKTDATAVTDSAYVIRQTFSGSDFDYWSVIVFHEKLLATNRGVDNIVIWEGPNVSPYQVSDLACSYKTTFLYSYNERVLLLRTIEGGDEKPFRIRWSGLGNEADWAEPPTSDSGSMEVNEGDGVLQGAATYRGNLIIFKTFAMVRVWNVESEMVFNKSLLFDIGTNAPDSIFEMEDGIYFYGGDNTFRFFDGLVPRVISSEIEHITKNINPNFEQYIQVTFIEELNQILWAIAEANSEINNKVLIYDLNFARNNWGVENMEVASLGYYETEAAYDWSSMSMFVNWLDWWWPSWKYRAGLAAFPIDVIGSYDGKVYRLNGSEKDVGEDYTGYQVLETDLGGGKRLSIFDRLLLIQAYIRQEAAGTLDFHIKRDDEPNFQSAGSVNLAGDREILIRELSVDFLAKTFKIKISGQTPFKFLGCILKYEPVGER